MLLLAPLLSGFSALIWQILWARELGLVFGGTTQAVAVTTALFLAGTGLGARLAAGSRLDPARGYAACEAVVAAWGVLTWPLLVAAAGAGVGGLALGADGWWAPSLGARLWQLVLTIGVLGVPTIAMGAALPLLAPAAVSGAASLGRLAAANTIGAAAGAFAADLWVIPALGLQRAGVLAAVLGGVAATVALTRQQTHSPLQTQTNPAPALAALVTGFAAMGFEVLWYRFLGSALGPYRAVFSLLLGVLLTAWAIGAAVGSRVAAAQLFTWSQASVAILALSGLYLHDNEALLLRQLSATSALDLHLVNLVTVAIVVAPAAFAMGIGFAALARHGSDPRGTAGRLWFATTFGNAAGALVTGLVLLPVLGMTRVAALLAGLSALSPMSVPGSSRLVSASALVLVGTFALLPADTLVWSSFPAGRAQEEGVLAVDEGVDETIVVSGAPEGPARLWTNGHPMSATTPRGQRYMRLLAHVPLLGSPGATDVLVICFGVGNTLHAASLHPVANLTLADVSRGVLAHASWFEHANHGVLRDPRVRVVVDDGRHVLHTMTPGSLDVITLEPPPMAHAGVAALYSREFYALARDRLREGGWITQWLPAYQVPEDTVRALIGAFIEVFPDGALLVGAGRELILVGTRGGPPVLRDVATRLRERPEVAADLAAVDIAGADDLAALFGADADRLRQVAGGGLPSPEARRKPGLAALTDDSPSVEWSQVSHVTRTRLPEGLLDPEGWDNFVPEARLDAERLAASRAAWSDPAFVAFSNVPALATPPRPTPAPPPGGR